MHGWAQQQAAQSKYRTVGIYSGPLGFGYNPELLAKKKLAVPRAVARGEATVSITFVHDAPGEKMQGFPVETVTPAEGTGAEIGSMSIAKGARNLEAAKKFYEWALTAPTQEMGAAAKQFQLPSNKSAKVDARVPDFKKIKFIDYDYAKYGASAERRRLIGKWEKDVNSLPR